jgi:hypothetical protein
MAMIARLLCPVFLLAAAAAPMAWADDGKPSGAGVCLQLVRVDHTTIKNDHTILFHMRDHTVWQNVLPEDCDGLKIENGFIYNSITPSDMVCSNLQTIRVLRRSGSCFLGAFTPYEPTKQ